MEECSVQSEAQYFRNNAESCEENNQVDQIFGKHDVGSLKELGLFKLKERIAGRQNKNGLEVHESPSKKPELT